jgi:hypothetical protein
VYGGIAAASFGLGLWQNSVADSKAKQANDLGKTASEQSGSAYGNGYGSFKDKRVSAEHNMNLRTAFYAGAGVFGAVALVSIFF